MVNIINLTPHPIHILEKPYHLRKIRTTLLPDPNTVTLKFKTKILKRVQLLDGAMVEFTKNFYDPTDLPPQLPGTYYVVSSIVADNLMEFRPDLLIVNGIVRTPSGEVIGCKTLSPIHWE